ncbi:hypothetical protein F4809DRAFT_294007 [Biscogniauxia mediterranea]|nr:hypothetical protein F4809DRAFT_294007 [Biscogniauxia mediterranea]
MNFRLRTLPLLLRYVLYLIGIGCIDTTLMCLVQGRKVKSLRIEDITRNQNVNWSRTLLFCNHLCSACFPLGCIFTYISRYLAYLLETAARRRGQLQMSADDTM